MERPERYDPEDLEHLMLERSFDELLEEERAYALRHLESRAEYERMRALLHHVREERDESLPGDAGPAVRERVLQAFRAQRQPQWRIWLNSVGGLLLPARPATFARPLLALGTVTALLLGSLALWNNLQHDGEPVLAEVKQETNAPTVRAPAGTADEAEPAPPVEDLALEEEALEHVAVAGKSMVTQEVVEPPSRTRASAEKQLAATDAAPQLWMNTEGYVSPAELEQESVKQFTAVTGQSVQAISSEPTAPAAKRDADMSPAQAVDDAVMGMAAETTAPAHREDELLGLLRAAW